MTDMDDSGAPLHGAVAQLTAMKAGDSALQTYAAWAPRYEADLMDDYGYIAHTIAAKALALACPNQDVEVADLGCGTGLVAEALHALGIATIDGFDASAEMLEQANVKNLYRKLHQVDLTDVTQMPQAQYDAAIAVGVFGNGHVGPQSLACFVQPVKPGGKIVLYANGIPYVDDDYPSHLRRLEAQGIWHVDYTEQSNYMAKIDRPGWLVVATRCG